MGDLNVGQTSADDVYISGTVTGSFALTTSPIPVSGINLAGSFAITTVPVSMTPYFGSGLPILNTPDLRVLTWKGVNTLVSPSEITNQFRTVWEFTIPSGVTWRPMGMYIWSNTANVGFRLAERICMWRAKWGDIGSPAVLGATTFTVSEGSPGLPVGSYYYKITACTNAGESLPTASDIVLITAGSQRVRVTSPAQAKGICYWKLYRTAVDVAQGNEAFVDAFPAYVAGQSIYDDVHLDADRITTNIPPVSDTTARQLDVSGTNNVEISEVALTFTETWAVSKKICFNYTDHANRTQYYEHDPGAQITVGEGFDLLINRDGMASSDQVAFPRPPAIEVPYTGSARTYQRLFVRDITAVSTSPAPTGGGFDLYGYRPLLHSDCEVLSVGIWQRPITEMNLPGGTEIVLQTTGNSVQINMFVEIVFRQV